MSWDSAMFITSAQMAKLMCWVDGGSAIDDRSCCEAGRTGKIGWLSCVACGVTEHGKCWSAQRLDSMAEGSDPDVQPPSFADWPASEATKWGNSWTTAGDQLEKLLRVLELKREAYVLPHRCARCVDRPWDAMARLRSTINGIDDWNRLFELV